MLLTATATATATVSTRPAASPALRRLATAALLALPLFAQAQVSPDRVPGQKQPNTPSVLTPHEQVRTVPAPPGLYDSFGGAAGMKAVVDEFLVQLLADPRMRPFFEDVDQAELKVQLASQFCQVAGGPCRYEGKDMKKAHEGLDINKSQFNALVEALQRAMTVRGVPFRAQNQLLARLAPFHRQIINVE